MLKQLLPSLRATLVLAILTGVAVTEARELRRP